jgi:hypothetical protein
MYCLILASTALESCAVLPNTAAPPLLSPEAAAAATAALAAFPEVANRVPVSTPRVAGRPPLAAAMMGSISLVVVDDADADGRRALVEVDDDALGDKTAPTKLGAEAAEKIQLLLLLLPPLACTPLLSVTLLLLLLLLVMWLALPPPPPSASDVADVEGVRPPGGVWEAAAAAAAALTLFVSVEVVAGLALVMLLSAPSIFFTPRLRIAKLCFVFDSFA